MINKIIKTLRSKLCSNSDFAVQKKIMLGMLACNDYCIAFNKKQDIPIWNYMLSEDKINLFVYDEDDNTIYDGLVIDAPDYIFKHGEIFSIVSFKGLNLDENIASRKNFYLFEENNQHLRRNI